MASESLVYTINSNILYASLEAPKLSLVMIDSTSPFVRQITDFYIQRFASQTTVLLDSVQSGFDKLQWEVSEDGRNYTAFGNDIVTNSITKVPVFAEMERAYYRLVATNSCGVSKTEPMFVEV